MDLVTLLGRRTALPFPSTTLLPLGWVLRAVTLLVAVLVVAPVTKLPPAVENAALCSPHNTKVSAPNYT
jgi:hypothetical protein